MDGARNAAQEVMKREPGFTIRGYVAGLSYRNSEEIERFANGLRAAGLPD